MHLSVLMTNTDESEFADQHPKDGEKFTRMIQLVRPDWQVSSFDVKDGVFPDNPLAFDGIMITGSPASVLENAGWMRRLSKVIKEAHRAQLPMFGACFGHQAIALALGGHVAANPAGWAFGVIEMRREGPIAWFEGPDRFTQYGAHIEHVDRLPEGARVIFSAPHCPVAGFSLGQHIYTTQNHPEMTQDFATALVAEYGPKLPADVATRAKASLEKPVDQVMFAQSIALFFEQAVRARSAD